MTKDVEIHLSQGPFSADLGVYSEWLPEAELERAERYSHEGARSLFLEGRRLCRTLLSQRLGVEPRRVELQMNEHGRPDVSEVGLTFNLSHTDGLVACAITHFDSRLGVDVERIDRNTNLERVGKRSFSNSEFRAFEQAADRVEAFYGFWTMKEAYIKARGVGVSLGLDRFVVGVEGLEPDFGAVDDDAADWSFYRARRGRYRIACAIDVCDAKFSILTSFRDEHSDQFLGVDDS